MQATKNIKITVISGTNRKNSLTESVATYYSIRLREKGCNNQLLKLVDLPSDFTVSALYENNGKNKAFNRFREVIKASEKLVFIVPEYNSSFPGVLKAFIDGLEFPVSFNKKKCALVGLSKGIRGAILGLSHLTDIFHHLGMYIYPFKPYLSRIPDNKIASVLENELYAQLLEEQIEGFIHY
ncbi:MAG: NAD(P)H-dependent oxidoreductase [Cytophagales bacterium]|nr:NAD(P)H-dependent oxidoreductase [Cytophagales bacterium]